MTPEKRIEMVFEFFAEFLWFLSQHRNPGRGVDDVQKAACRHESMTYVARCPKRTSDMRIEAWHFLNGTKLRDGREAPPDGVPLHHEGSLALCERGLHASVDILDALRSAPGATLCRVTCESYVESNDKLVCSTRTILWRVDEQTMCRVLVWWAFWCAERSTEAASWSTEAAEAAEAAAEAVVWAAEAAAWSAAVVWAAEAAASRSAEAWSAEQDVQRTELLRLIELAKS